MNKGPYISNALEEYLKTIYILHQTKQNVRITDIASYLNISKPSVNRAVKHLKHLGLVCHEPYGSIFLTSKGKELGELYYNKYNMLKDFLIIVLNIPSETAKSEAGKLVHNISQSTLEKMNEFMTNQNTVKYL